jgi:hypothetical protein
MSIDNLAGHQAFGFKGWQRDVDAALTLDKLDTDWQRAGRSVMALSRNSGHRLAFKLSIMHRSQGTRARVHVAEAIHLFNLALIYP